MSRVLAAHLWPALQITPSQWPAELVWSWDHHDTLRYLIGGVVLLLMCWRGAKKEWRLPLVVATGIGGLICVLIALGLALLGDFARNDHGMARMVAREVRMSHMDQLLPPGSDCKVATQCVLGAVCARAEADSQSRCWMPCGSDGGCPVTQRCVRGSHKTRVCTP